MGRGIFLPGALIEEGIFIFRSRGQMSVPEKGLIGAGVRSLSFIALPRIFLPPLIIER